MQSWYEEWGKIPDEIYCCYLMNRLARNGLNSVSASGSCHLKLCHLQFLFWVLVVLFTEVLGYRKIRHNVSLNLHLRNNTLILMSVLQFKN